MGEAVRQQENPAGAQPVDPGVSCPGDYIIGFECRVHSVSVNRDNVFGDIFWVKEALIPLACASERYSDSVTVSANEWESETPGRSVTMIGL